MSTHASRRTVLRLGGLALGLAVTGDPLTASAAVPDRSGRPGDLSPGGVVPPGGDLEDSWAEAARIRARIRPPRFPARRFEITRYGAVGDGTTDCTGAIRRAIEECRAAGGGHVVVPAGTFLTGAVRLRSTVDLHLEDGSTLLFRQDPAAYLPLVLTRFQGIELLNYSPFVYAYGEENIAITGSGTLDGQGDTGHWWPWKGSAASGWTPGQPNEAADWALLQQQAQDGVPVARRVFGPGHYLRPVFVQPYRCRNVLIEGVTVHRSPMWELNPVLCTNVTVRGVHVDSHGPNNDGCDPECCDGVLIEGCTFSTGDDCIAIKAGRNADGRRVGVPSQNILIRDCDFADGHGGVTIGSEMTGGVRNVFVEQLRMSSPNLNNAVRLKTNSARGGFIENLHVRGVTVGQVAQTAVMVDYFYDEGPGHGFDPTVDRIRIEDLTVDSCRQPWYLVGYPEDPIGRVELDRCTFRRAATPGVVQYVTDLKLRDTLVNGTPATM